MSDLLSLSFTTDDGETRTVTIPPAYEPPATPEPYMTTVPAFDPTRPHDVANYRQVTLIQSALLAVTRTVEDISPAGTVLGVTPAIGSTVPAGSVVEVMVSAGPDYSVIPSIVGLKALASNEVKDFLYRWGLLIGSVESERIESIPHGTVISQDPEAGTPKGSTRYVNMVVSNHYL